MSRGPGIQNAMEAAFNSSPDRVWSTHDLAPLAYPGKAITYDRIDAVRRAADNVAGRLGWLRRREVGITEYCSRETAERIKLRRAKFNAEVGIPNDADGARAMTARLCDAIRAMPPETQAHMDRQAEILLTRVGPD